MLSDGENHQGSLPKEFNRHFHSSIVISRSRGVSATGVYVVSNLLPYAKPLEATVIFPRPGTNGNTHFGYPQPGDYLLPPHFLRADHLKNEVLLPHASVGPSTSGFTCMNRTDNPRAAMDHICAASPAYNKNFPHFNRCSIPIENDGCDFMRPVL